MRRSRLAAETTSADAAARRRRQGRRDRDPGLRLAHGTMTAEVARVTGHRATTTRHVTAVIATRHRRLLEEDEAAVESTATHDARIRGRAPTRESAITRKAVGHRDATVVTSASRRAGSTATTGSAMVEIVTEWARLRIASALAMRKKETKNIATLMGNAQKRRRPIVRRRIRQWKQA